jgi:hypothetical protein
MQVDYQQVVGQRRGRLLIISYEGKQRAPRGLKEYHMYKCKCDCGREVLVQRNGIVTYQRSSCGCKQSRAHQNAMRRCFTSR